MLKNFLIVFLISMLPLIELRGAVPAAVGFGLPILPSILIAIIGNILPMPLIFFFAQRILEWGAKTKFEWFSKFCNFAIKKGKKGGKKLLAKGQNGVYLTLLLFVGVPLPGTGAWTGTLAASILELDFKKSLLAVMAGTAMAGVIMLALSLGVSNILF